MKIDNLSKFQDAVKEVYQSEAYKKRREDMNRFLKYYKGDYWREKAKVKGETEIACNFIFSTIQAIAPLLTDNRPIWYLRARKYFMQRFLQVYSDALEYGWDKWELDPKLFEVVVDSMLTKLGIWKIYWNEDDEVEIEVVDPRTFVCAPGYEDIWKAPWCGTVVRQPISWVRDTFGEKADEIKPENDDLAPDETYVTTDKSSVELASKYVTVFEVWVRDSTAEKNMVEGAEGKKEKVPKYPHGRIITFAQGKVLDDKPSPFRHNKPPYVSFKDYIVPHELFGMGEPDQIEGLTLEFNLALKKVAQYVRDYVTPDWAIDGASGINADKFKEERKGGDNVWEYNTGAEPPRILEVPQINRTILDFISSVPALIEEVSGVVDITKGMAVKKQRQTAGEVATLVESAYTRTRQRVRNLEASLKRALYLIVDIMQQFYTEERDYTVMRDGEIVSGQVSNQAGFAKNVMEPKEEPKTDEEKQQYEDYKKLCDYLGDEEEVYVDFDMEIQTNSTLPMDRQSLANLMLRLFELKGVDAQALLETLRVPKADEIVSRLQQQEQTQNAPAQPPVQEALNV